MFAEFFMLAPHVHCIRGLVFPHIIEQAHITPLFVKHETNYICLKYALIVVDIFPSYRIKEIDSSDNFQAVVALHSTCLLGLHL